MAEQGGLPTHASGGTDLLSIPKGVDGAPLALEEAIKSILGVLSAHYLPKSTLSSSVDKTPASSSVPRAAYVNFAMAYIGYACLLSCRKPFSAAKPYLVDEMGFPTNFLGIVDASMLLFYSLGSLLVGPYLASKSFPKPLLLGLSLIATCFGILFARLQDKMESASHAQNFLSALLAMLLCIGSGTALVMTTEGWSLLDSIYWSVVTSSSTGFGDLTIENSTTRLLATPYMLISVGCFAASLGRLGSIIMDIETDRAVRAFVARGVFHDMLQEMDGDGSGSIDMCEFLRYMLIKLGKVKDSDIQMIQDMFDKLDTDRSGTLDVHDIRAEQARLEGTPLPKLVPAKSASITQDSPSFWRWASGVSSLMQDLKKPLMS